MNHTYYNINENLSNIKDTLTTIEALKIEIEQKKSSQQARWQAVQERLRVDWTFSTNAIEGSSLSRGETLFFLQEGLTVEGKPFKDFLDARNHAEAIDWLYEIITHNRAITPGVIKEINALLLSGVTYTWAMSEIGQKVKKPTRPGQYKTQPNHVLKADGAIHFYTDPLHVSAEIEALCDWIEQSLSHRHPLIIATIAHYNLVRIHPFDDGNGRGARILMNLILIQHGYPIVIIKTEIRRTYLETLNQADQGDIYPFLSLVKTAFIETGRSIVRGLDET